LILEDRREEGLRGVSKDAVPRRKEIPNILAKKICRSLARTPSAGGVAWVLPLRPFVLDDG